MNIVPPITRTRVTEEKLRARVDAWKTAHPGFGEHNFPDAFRFETGELIEDEAFFTAASLFSQFALLDE